MTLRPSDMMVIQSAIDEYEKKYPRRPAPSAEVALAWRLGKREAARRMRLDESEPASKPETKPASQIRQQECSRWTWAWEQMKLHWNMGSGTGFNFLHDPTGEGASAWVEGVLRVGWWGLVIAVSVTVFAFGAVIGGLK